MFRKNQRQHRFASRCERQSQISKHYKKLLNNSLPVNLIIWLKDVQAILLHIDHLLQSWKLYKEVNNGNYPGVE